MVNRISASFPALCCLKYAVILLLIAGTSDATATCKEPSEDVINDMTRVSSLLEWKDPTEMKGLFRDVHETSLCPWVYKIDSNSTRYPRDITYAQCTRLKCKSLEKREGTQCQEMRIARQVFVQTVCIDGVWRYEPTMVWTPVGCTCGINGSGGKGTEHKKRHSSNSATRKRTKVKKPTL